jgi:hypothetical protein
VSTAAKKLMTSTGRLDPWGRDRAAFQEHQEIAKALNAEARENWDNEAWHRQVAVDLQENLDYGFINENLFGSYINVQNVGEFDRVTIRERRGLKVFYTSRGGYIDESQLTSEIWELPRDTMGFHVSEHIDKLRANFAETIDELATLGQARMEAEVNRRILSLAQAAVPAGSDYYVAANDFGKEELDAAIREVRDAIRPDGSGPVPVTILGRAGMLDKIQEIPGYSDEALEEVRLRGRLGVYRGAQIVEIKNFVDEDGVAYQPGNELWVLGGNAGKFALYGGVQVKTWDENTVDYRHYRARRDIGGLIHHPEQIRRIVDTSVAA